MNMVMCRACGEFVTAVKRDGTLTPISDSCPKCKGTEFKDIDTETVIRTDDEAPAVD